MTSFEVSLGLIIPLAALSWTIGFITPWAPAGLGVREGVLVWGLGPSLGTPLALLVGVVARLVVVIPDLLLAFLISLIYQKMTINHKENDHDTLT